MRRTRRPAPGLRGGKALPLPGGLLIALLLSHGAVAATKICCVGNSITVSPFGNAYPERLGRLLGSQYQVSNCGDGGTTLQRSGDLSYWYRDQFNQIFTAKPAIILIKLGTNDSKPWNWKGTEAFTRDYTAMIDTFNTISTRPKIYLVLCTPAFSPQEFQISGDTIHLRIVPAIRSIALARGLPVIDCHTPLLDHPELFPDKIHPSAAGADSIARIAYRTLTAVTPTVVQPRILPRQFAAHECGAVQPSLFPVVDAQGLFDASGRHTADTQTDRTNPRVRKPVYVLGQR